MNKEINEIFEQWKQFLFWCYENNDKTTEIHRDDLERVMTYTRQLENIIKEVREYIEEHLEREYFDYDILEANTIYNRDLYKVLKILDKAGNSNERKM